MSDRWQHIPEAPPPPEPGDRIGDLTVDDLFAPPPQAQVSLDEKVRQAYFWLVNSAVVLPYHDIEFSTAEPVTFSVGDSGAVLTLPTDQSYASGVLVPLLAFAVGGRCLLVGGPGRGKTTVATVLAVMAGSTPAQVRRDIQQGQPQLSISDLVGMPLPKDLLGAERLADVRIAWREWLTAPVKIVDEVNRIPTKTQSALLTMVADGYVESHDQLLTTAPTDGVESWFFTANDDAGGGTFALIQALRDRMDVTVTAMGYNPRFLDELIARVERGERPEEHVPSELVFGPAERAAVAAGIRAVPVPPEVVSELSSFAAHFEFAQHGGRTFEHRTKDVITTGGGRVGEVIDLNTGADVQADLGAETASAPSPRALQALILYAKAMAWFRGRPAVGSDDVAAVLPFVLRGKVAPNLHHPAFDGADGAELRTDTGAWLSTLWERARRERLARDEDPVGALLAQLRAGLAGVSRAEVSARLTAVESRIAQIADTGKLYGATYTDLLTLKHVHQRYRNYLTWLDATGGGR
ncbi:ATPase [Mycobacterium sp. GA-1841]|uniref:AAA family ATPase n=1 Tax=Mycobacterium sp. GA-1841 TaxID=1834154 RepID=UPI00096CD18A|nr:MoxR family ATPase [Mycobacterium sp. GA-1841]OMC40281.1 ATPase [Mycobacterium sp. GA-1841]